MWVLARTENWRDELAGHCERNSRRVTRADTGVRRRGEVRFLLFCWTIIFLIVLEKS